MGPKANPTREQYRREQWEFRIQYRSLYSIIEWEFPEFWREFRELEGRRPARNAGTREDRPRMKEVGVQVTWEGGHLRDAATQTELTPGRPSPMPIGLPKSVKPKPERPTEKPGPPKSKPRVEDPGEPLPISPAGCWNCGSRVHRYSRCPRPRERVFCFACGHTNVSIKDCPRCGGAWAQTAARRGSHK
jgi:hypothetical protein